MNAYVIGPKNLLVLLLPNCPLIWVRWNMLLSNKLLWLKIATKVVPKRVSELFLPPVAKQPKENVIYLYIKVTHVIWGYNIGQLIFQILIHSQKIEYVSCTIVGNFTCLMNHNLACTGSNQTQDTDKAFCFDNINISIIFKIIQRNYHTKPFLVFSSKTSCLNLLRITKLEIKFPKLTLF